MWQSSAARPCRGKKAKARNKEYAKARKADEHLDARSYQPSNRALAKAAEAEPIHTEFDAKDLSAAHAAWIGKRLDVEAVNPEIQHYVDCGYQVKSWDGL